MKLITFGLLFLLIYSNAFAARVLWDLRDPWFDDLNNDGILDVNSMINQEAKKAGVSLPMSTAWFKKLEIFEEELGYYMPYFVDNISLEAYCPSARNYNSANPLFRVLGRVIRVDTEGLYFGVNDSNGSFKIALVPERKVKATWFYYRHGIPTAPTAQDLLSEKIYFRHSALRYEIRSLKMLTGEETRALPAHDLKVGCVPVR